MSAIPQQLLFPTRAAVVAVIALMAFPAIGMVAHAADTDPIQSAATLRAQADAIARHYFDALEQYQSLDREITENKQVVSALVAQARTARVDARASALAAYRTSSSQLSSIVSSDDALTAARRLRLIDSVNARDQATYRRLHTATKELNAHRRALEADQHQQADALAQLEEQSSAMEAKLALAQQQEQAAAAQAAQAAQAAASQAAATAATQVSAAPTAQPAAPATEAAPAPPPAPPSVAPANPPAPTAPAAPAGYTGTPGTHPMHNDPFLTCVRARESGGNYSVINPAGPYLGAYQFLQATWNGAANHAGRSDLVGVPANLATPYDQDDLAWSLYQWQGPGPWGGSCS